LTDVKMERRTGINRPSAYKKRRRRMTFYLMGMEPQQDMLKKKSKRKYVSNDDEVISVGNRAFHANQDLFKSKLLTKKSKLRMYQTLVRPVVTYACETWVLKENIKTKLRVFERKVLRRIYRPTKESDGTWRIKSNEELNRLIGNKNIISYIEAQRLAWFGHVHRMPDNSMVKRVYEWSPALTRSLGRPKNSWENDVKSDINMKITNWRDCIRNRPKRKEFVEKAKTSLKL